MRSCGGAYSDSPWDQTGGYLQEPIVSESTPFFHVDLFAAVQAVEKLRLKADEQERRGETGPQSDILIDLHD